LTAVTQVDALRVALLDHQQRDVRHHGPEGDAQEEVERERAIQEAMTGAHAEIHNGSFIWMLIVAELAWVATVCYAVLWFLS
jgi:hypothetical protein